MFSEGVDFLFFGSMVPLLVTGAVLFVTPKKFTATYLTMRRSRLAGERFYTTNTFALDVSNGDANNNRIAARLKAAGLGERFGEQMKLIVTCTMEYRET